MEKWQRLMKTGNQHYQMKQWEEAIYHYNQSITLLEDQEFLTGKDSLQSIQAWVCGYHNLAKTYEQQGLIQRCRDMLIIPFMKLNNISNQSYASPEMQLTIHRSLKVTLLPLLTFANNYPNESQFIDQLLKDINNPQSIH